MTKKIDNTKNKQFLSVREKLEFIQKHCKEPELFEDLRQLFKKKGFKNVVIEHGSKEYGKDLVFSITDPVFEEEKWYAAIVKNKNASQNDFVTGGEILQQVELSLKVPFTDTKGNKHTISGVFIIINGSVSFNAKDIMQQFISPTLLPHIKIWDYQLLAGEIEDHIKDMFLDKIEPIIHVFSKAQITRLSDLRATQQLFDLNIQDIDDIFVNVQTSYSKHLKRLDKYVSFDNGKKEKKVDDDIDGTKEILASRNNFLIHGIATSGKSLLLRRLGIKALQPRNGKPNVVFYFELPKILPAGKKKKIDFIGLIHQQYAELTSGETFNSSDFEKILVLIDSLDEIKSNEVKTNILKEIDAFASTKEVDNLQIILTSRTTEIIDKEMLLTEFEKSELLPFNIGQALRLVNKIIPDNKKKSNAFIRALKDTLLTSGLLRTPLALTLMAILYRDDKIDLKELPANITELYNKFVDTYLDRWDVTKGITRQYQYEQTKNILAYIALQFNLDGITSATKPELVEILSEMQEEFSYEELQDIDAFIEHLKWKNGVFNFDENSERFSFYNQYFQEYFVSIAIDDTNEEILKSNFFSDWWENAIVFYCGKQPRRDAFIVDACDHVVPIGLKNQYTYIQLLSKSLQASHSISIKSRLKIVKKIVAEFDSFYKNFIEGGKTGQTFAAVQSTMNLIITFREFFEKLFASKHIANDQCIKYFEDILLDQKAELSDVTRYCIAYFTSTLRGAPYALEIFVSDKDLSVIWNRIVYVDINFLHFKKAAKKESLIRIRRKMTKNKFSIIEQLKGSSINYLEKSTDETTGTLKSSSEV